MKTLGLAKQLQAEGVDVINMGIGEPDFTTPEVIETAAITAIKTGKASFYTPASGLTELKQAISDHFADAFQLNYDLDQIAVTTGAKMALYATFQAILDPGDEVLLPEPYWVSYAEQIKLAGAKPVAVPLDANGQLTVDLLAAKATDQTKAIILNSPQNPTGEIYSRDELIAFGNWAVNQDIVIISDEIYGELVYNGQIFHSMGALGEQIKAQTIIINGVSKTYSMTGWRIGIVMGDAQMIKAISAFVSHATGNPAAVSQYASIEAFRSGAAAAEKMRKEFETRLNTIYPKLVDIPGFRLTKKPEGAFYLFPNIEEALALTQLSSTEFVSGLLTEAHVAVVDGIAFGVPGHIRLSYALSLEQLETGVERIKNFVIKNSSGGKNWNEAN